MIEWVKLSSLIVDQIFNYGPKINDIFKSKESKNKKFKLKILCNDIANQLQKNLLSDLKVIMDHSINVPLKKEDFEEINKLIKNVIDNESNFMEVRMKDLAINLFNEIIMDNLLCTPKYHNLVIIGSNKIYNVINKIYDDNITVKDNIEKFQLFCTQKAEFRPGLLLYALNISDRFDLEQLETPLDLNKTKDKDNKDNKDNIINDKENNENKNLKDNMNMKKVSNEILSFIKNQNKLVKNDLNRKITGIIICIDNKNEYEQIKELINFLNISINKYKLQLDIYLININKCVDFKYEKKINNKIKNNNNEENEIKDNIDNNNNMTNNNNIVNDNNIENDIINQKEENNNKEKDVKQFPMTICDKDTEILDEEEINNEVDNFLNELVNKYIDDYMKNNMENIHCILNLQFSENIKYYFQKLQKEFDKAVEEMKVFNLKTIPLKVEFESQIKKIYNDIIINHIYPIAIRHEKKKIIKNILTNESLNNINDFFNYNLNKVKELTTKGKDEYAMRLIGQVKEKINELFTQLDLDQEGEKERLDEYISLKKSFVNDITQILNEKIAFSSDVYDLCLSYVYISKSLYKTLYEKIIAFCQNNILQNKEFKEDINKRIIQQIDSFQRRVLNID